MQNLIITVIFIILGFGLSAQENDQIIKDIHFYADVVANAMDYEHKVRANDQLVSLIDKAIDSGIDIDFDAIKWIPEVKPVDGSFSIVTWPIQNTEDSHFYQGYIFKGNKVIKLNDQAAVLMDDYKYMIGDQENWFGQMYYGIEEFQSGDQTKYVLFGRNSFTRYENIKMADIFYFDDKDMPVFGEQLFAQDMNDLKNASSRIILQYSDDAPINLNYNPGLGMIVYDHLVPRMGQIAGQGIIMTGDGSYEGYQLKEGIWLHKEKIFDHVYEEAPRPTPIFDENKSSKDIFGKSRDKN